MCEKVNLLKLVEETSDGDQSAYGLVRLGENQTAVIPFTADGERVKIHYCHETEIRSYVACNGEGCVLCRAGRDPDERLLIPVYVPAAQAIGILPVPTSLRPKALLPQLCNVLKASKPMVAFITRRNDQYTVATAEVPEGADDGATVIREFKTAYDAGTISLVAAYQRLDNTLLASIPEIATMLKLKGGPA